MPQIQFLTQSSTETFSNDVNVAEMMCKLVNQESAPEIDIDVFGGNPLEFHYFMAVFDEVVEKKIEDPHGKLTSLIKYTTGEVKEMLKNCIQLPPKEGYENSKQMMHKLYGDPQRVITAYHKEIKQLPQIKKEMLKHIESFITSSLNVRILHKCRHEMFWTLLKLCAC